MSHVKIRGAINKFVENVCHLFDNQPVQMIFANNILCLVCLKLETHFSYIVVIPSIFSYRLNIEKSSCLTKKKKKSKMYKKKRIKKKKKKKVKCTKLNTC